MKVLINGHEVDFTLENEKTVNDLLSSVENWGASRGLVVNSISIDGETSFNGLDKPLDDIGEIYFSVQSKADLVMDTLNEAAAYCDRAVEYIESGKVSVDTEDLAGGLEWLADIFSQIFSIFDVSPSSVVYLGKNGEDYISALRKHSKEILEKKHKPDATFLRDVKGVAKVLIASDLMRDLIIKNIESPDELVRMIAEVKDLSAQQITNLEEISTLFQSGKDAKASEKLQEFIDFLHGYIRLSCQIKPVFGIDLSDIRSSDSVMSEVNDGINLMLNEIVGVMENNDIISLSDILEYELKVQMEKIPGLIDVLSRMIIAGKK